MSKDERAEVRCWYVVDRPGPVGAHELRPLFEDRTVTGRPMSARYIHESPFAVPVAQISLMIVVHVVAHGTAGQLNEPVVDQNVVEDMLDVANEIWGQACIKLAPYYHGELIKEFHDIELLGAFGDCLNAEWKQKLKPYDITTPDKLIINLYLVDDANFACGSPISGHVILPTAGKGSEWLGKVLAHEIGHVLLNPLGIDNSDDPDHVMYHPENHPGVPLGSRDGLFMSDCLGVRKRVAEDFGGFADVPGGTSPAPLSCIMLPRLGNNLVVIEAMQQK